MAVVREFALPDLGEGLTEAEIVRWMVQVGDVVAIDQPVVEVETAKAVVEVPCPYGGVVTARFGEEGQTLDVGRPLLTVAVGSPTGRRPPPRPPRPTATPGPATCWSVTGPAAPRPGAAGCVRRRVPRRSPPRPLRLRWPQCRSGTRAPWPSSPRWCGAGPVSTVSTCAC